MKLMSQAEQERLLVETIIPQILHLRKAGQAEYAHDLYDAHANFRRQAARKDVSPEFILSVYMDKHLDGIQAYLNGHESQRGSVKGRIADVMVYLALLWGLVECKEYDQKVQGELIKEDTEITEREK